MNSKQDDFLDIISQLDESQLNSLIANLETNEKLETPTEALKESLDKIKSRTYNKINQNPNEDTLQINSKKKNFFSPKKIAATAAVLSLFILPFSGNVIASIKDHFKYIPGNNQIVESKGNEDVFALKKPVKVNTKHGYLELTSLVIDNDKNFVSIAARGEESDFELNLLTMPKNCIKLKNEQIIQIDQGGCASGDDGNWDMHYSTSDKLKGPLNYKEGDIIQAVIEFEDKINVTVPVTLEKVKNYEAYAEIGPTCVKNDLSITAVPLWYDGKLNVNLLYSMVNQKSTENYNPEYNYIGSVNEPLLLIDKDNNKHKNNIYNSNAPSYELNFNVKGKENNLYKLNIPFIKTTYNNRINHKIELPKVGEKITYTNKVINLGEYKLKVISAERKVKDAVIIEVDTGYDDNKIESLCNVRLTAYNVIDCSYYDESDKRPIPPLKQWTISLDSNASDLTLPIESFDTIKKGPWIINIPGEAIKR